MRVDDKQTLLFSTPNGTGTNNNQLKTFEAGGSGGAPGYAKPFDITKSGLDVTVKNLIVQVGNQVYETSGTLAFTVSANGFLWAKIDVSNYYEVVDLVMSTSLDYYVDKTEDGQYYFKALYKITKATSTVSVAIDLRDTQLPLLA